MYTGNLCVQLSTSTSVLYLLVLCFLVSCIHFTFYILHLTFFTFYLYTCTQMYLRPSKVRLYFFVVWHFWIYRYGTFYLELYSVFSLLSLSHYVTCDDYYAPMRHSWDTGTWISDLMLCKVSYQVSIAIPDTDRDLWMRWRQGRRW